MTTANFYYLTMMRLLLVMMVPNMVHPVKVLRMRVMMPMLLLLLLLLLLLVIIISGSG